MPSVFEAVCASPGTLFCLRHEALCLSAHRPLGHKTTHRPDCCSRTGRGVATAVAVTLRLPSSLLLPGRHMCVRRRSLTVKGYLVSWPGETSRKKGIKNGIGRESVKRMADDITGRRVYDWTANGAQDRGTLKGSMPMASQNHERLPRGLGLSRRPAEILGLLAEGLSDREIAERLVMTINTVKW